jgi:glucose/arabinose dehydrogenase
VIARGIPLPTSFAFAPGGKVFVGAADRDRGGPRAGVYLIGARATARRVLSVPTGAAVAWWAGRLLVATSGHLAAYPGFDGAFAKESLLLTGLPAWVNAVAVGPGGRIWITIGGDCDSCAPTANFAGTVLELQPDGGEPTIVARRLRQPYGLAFPPGSPTPLVTAVGQDDLGVAAPPDAIVRATPDADFGFPGCNWADPATCSGFTAPVVLLAPHTTPTGIAVIGPTAYIGAYGPRSLLRMAVAGSKPAPFVTGFPSPVVAVGANHGHLYVGVESGTIYRIDP